MTTFVDMNSKTDKAVNGIKGRLKLLSMTYRIGWKAVYDHFEIDHKSQGETRKTVEQFFGEELDSDIEILNYKWPENNRPYSYGNSKPRSRTSVMFRRITVGRMNSSAITVASEVTI